jgi:hypothetical protein
MNSLLSTLILCITVTATGWHFGAKIFDEMDRPTAPKRGSAHETEKIVRQDSQRR